jgi:hypothetical protein
MPFGRIRQPVQALPLPHDDFEYLDQRFQAYYYAPDGTRQVICVEWNTRQHRAVFLDGNQRSFTVDVGRDFQITLQEVLELHGIIINMIQLENMNGQNLPDIESMLNQSVEDMELLGATIWSQPAYVEPVDQSLYQPQLEAAG